MSVETIKAVLLVEDNLGDVKLVRRMLAQPDSHQIELAHVHTVAGAEQYLAANSVDLVLLDLGLPDSQQLSALRRIRAAAPRTPVMVFTGQDEESLAAEALRIGAQDYLIKGNLTGRGLMRSMSFAVERKNLEEQLRREKDRAVDMSDEVMLASQRQLELTSTAESLNTQLRLALKEKDMLLSEIHHRVKNNLQIVNSLLDLQSAQITEPAVCSMLRDSQNRIRSMALIHQTLYQSKNFARVDFGSFLESLVPTLVQSYAEQSDRIILSINAAGIHLPIYVAIPCGLVMNELISNCLKHAFPGGRQGSIDIAFVREDDGQLLMTVTDDGVGIKESLDMTQTASLGLQLVFLLTDQVGGKMAVHRRDPTSFAMRFTLKDAPAETDAGHRLPDH